MNKCIVCNKETQHSISIGNDKYRLLYYTCGEHRYKVSTLVLDTVDKIKEIQEEHKIDINVKK